MDVRGTVRRHPYLTSFGIIVPLIVVLDFAVPAYAALPFWIRYPLIGLIGAAVFLVVERIGRGASRASAADTSRARHRARRR